MDIRREQFSDNLLKAVGQIDLSTPTDLVRALVLYTRIMNDQGVVNTISLEYVQNYDGKAKYKQFKKYFDQQYDMFNRNGMTHEDKHSILLNVARRLPKSPENVKDMKRVSEMVIEEMQKRIKFNKSRELRANLISKFKIAIKKYMNLTYMLGYNEPSLCVKNLATSHKIDKYMLSGDFSPILLPFLPDIENIIRESYENYEMKDSWEMLKGRYFNHKSDYMTLATEIKALFTPNIRNFSDYIDNLYTDKYRKLRLEGRK